MESRKNLNNGSDEIFQGKVRCYKDMAIDNAQKSIVEQIIDVTLEKLKRSGKYSQKTIDKLREIAKAGNLNQREPIVEALESQLEEFNETA